MNRSMAFVGGGVVLRRTGSFQFSSSAAMKALSLLSLLVAEIAFGGVIFSEIMYRPRHSDELQYVELFNTGSQLVDVSGWFLLYPGYIFQIPRHVTLLTLAALHLMPVLIY